MFVPTKSLPLGRRLAFFACLCIGFGAAVGLGAAAAGATPAPSGSLLGPGGGDPNKDRAPSQASATSAGGLTIFTDRPTFDAAFPGLPVEDFEAGAVADGAVVACPAPLDETGDGTCFGAGALEAGVVYQDNPGPDGTDGLLLIGDGAFGNPSKILSTNEFGDALELVFPEPVEALGLELFNLPGPDDALEIDVFTPGGELLGTVSSPSSSTGVFWGASSPDPIGRVVLRSTVNQVEAVDDVSFAVGRFLSLADVTSVDTCATDMTTENGVWEPNESVELSVTLRATGGGFTGITGALSSASPAFVVIEAEAAWPDLADGAAAANATSLRFLVADDICAEEIELTLDVSSDQGDFSIPLRDRIGFDQAPLVPLPIPDGALLGAVSTLEIETDVAIADLVVEVEIEHTWVGDLTITLESPGGTTAVLLDRPGVPDEVLGCDNNNVIVSFSDAAGVDPEGFCNPSSSDPWITGDVLPVQALAAFDGESSQGPWTLRVVDASAGDLGTLLDWRLEPSTPLGAECTVCALSSDVAIEKTCEGFPSYLCEIEVTNLGVSPSFDLVVTDTIPAPLFWLGDDCGAGPPAGNVLTWNAPPVDVGGSVICAVQFGAPPDASGEVVNVVDVVGGVPDPDVGNNTASALITLGTTLDIPTLGAGGVALLILALGGLGFRRLRTGRRP